MKPKPRVLILEGDEEFVDDFRRLLENEPVEVVVAKTAAEAWTLFKCDEFDVIALNEIASSGPGRRESLVGPIFARSLREAGYNGHLVGISSNPRVQELMKQAGGCSHSCEKERLHGLLRELLGLWPTTPA